MTDTGFCSRCGCEQCLTRRNALIIAAMKERLEWVGNNPERARAELIRSGAYNEDGSFNYGDEAEDG